MNKLLSGAIAAFSLAASSALAADEVILQCAGLTGDVERVKVPRIEKGSYQLSPRAVRRTL